MQRARGFALLGAIALIGAITACDAPTEPAAMRSVAKVGARIEGDTLECRSGWHIVNGRYVCNGEQ
jgi:hypothetical protein